MSVILVTGANGFIGRHLCRMLESRGYTVRQAVRSLDRVEQEYADRAVAVGDMDATTDWHAALERVDAVVHLASRAHILDDQSKDPLAAFREVNVAGTSRLARQAADAGVRRFIYLSSIKAVARTTGEKPFREDDPPRPDDPYGQSKLEAEDELSRMDQAGELDLVVIRPPLVYGPGVGANFLRMLKIVDKGIPLPFLGIENRRSIVSVLNLCDLVTICLEHEAAVGEVFHVSDGADVSTPGLLQKIGEALGRRPRLFRLPASVLRIIFRITGRPDDHERLCGSLHLDVEKVSDLLGWKAPVDTDDAIRQTVDWYVGQAGTK